jgi:hypothetical protein
VLLHFVIGGIIAVSVEEGGANFIYGGILIAFFTSLVQFIILEPIVKIFW